MGFASTLPRVIAVVALSLSHSLRAVDRPNILFILADDMGWQDTSVPFAKERTKWNDRYHTPALERLAREGVKFTQAYSCAVCSPTRVSLLTGQNEARHHVTNWTHLGGEAPTTDRPLAELGFATWNWNGLQPTTGLAHSVSAPTLPSLLKEAGYRTMNFGKGHLGAGGTPGEDPQAFGFDVRIGGRFAGGLGSYWGTKNFGALRQPGGPFRAWDLDAYFGKDIHLTEALTLEAKREIRAAVAGGQPFFCYFAHYAPHTPIEPDERFAPKYRTAGLDNIEAAYASLIEGMDKSVGDLLMLLDELDVADNTVIVFTSDNGGVSHSYRGMDPPHTHNTPLSSGKGSHHEGGIRVPLLVRWPGVCEAASVNETPVMIYDWFPTLLRAAKADVPGDIDGLDLAPLLRGEGSAAFDRPLIWHFPNFWGGLEHPGPRAGPGLGPSSTIRRGDWKLIYYHIDQRFELFDLASDLGEKNNLATQEPLRLRELATELSAILRQHNAPMPVHKATGKTVPLPAWLPPSTVTLSTEPAPPDGTIVVDDTQAEFTGRWIESTKQKPAFGPSYRHDGSEDRGAKTARFTPDLPAAGRYQVRVLYVPGANRASRVPVTIRSADGEKTVFIDQRREPQALEVFRFEQGKDGSVTLGNADADGFVVADAVMFVPEAVAGRTGAAAMAKPEAQAVDQPRVRLQVKPVRSSTARQVNGKAYDVIVIGGTPGGIACAVRAAREGLSVLLVQHNRHIGGMLTNGLMQWDALYGGPRAPIFNEYAKMIEEHYRTTYGADSKQLAAARYTQSHYPMSRFEPSAAEHLFNKLVSAEKNITTLLSHYPAAVQREGALLKALTLREYGAGDEITITGGTYVDATYEGDLAALAKVPYRVGRESREEYGEPHAGKVFTNISSESGPQDAKDGSLNIHPYGHVQGSIDSASPFSADGAIQAYNHRFCLTNEPGNFRLPDQPPGYNRDEYVNYNRKGMGGGAINGKSTFNSPILPGENHAYPDANWPEREKIIARHTNFALGLMWFLQNDESIPTAKREGYRRIGLPLDEYPDNRNLPYELYVREARRIVGRHVFTEHDNRLASGLTRTPIQADSIAFTDWSMDSHDCTTDRSPGYDYDGKLILTEESRPAQIPWRSLLPQGVDNLIVPVCLSATHVAWGAVRLEPVWMQSGEAAGFAATLAKKHQTTPGKLDPDLLVRTLVVNKHFVSFFNELQEQADHPAMPAAQYFATKGCFPDYDANLDSALTEAAHALWENGCLQLQNGTLDPMRLAADLSAAATRKSPASDLTRSEALQRFWRQFASENQPAKP